MEKFSIGRVAKWWWTSGLSVDGRGARFFIIFWSFDTRDDDVCRCTSFVSCVGADKMCHYHVRKEKWNWRTIKSRLRGVCVKVTSSFLHKSFVFKWNVIFKTPRACHRIVCCSFPPALQTFNAAADQIHPPTWILISGSVGSNNFNYGKFFDASL